MRFVMVKVKWKSYLRVVKPFGVCPTTIQQLVMINVVSWLLMVVALAATAETKHESNEYLSLANFNSNQTNAIQDAHNVLLTTPSPVSCEVARIKCALRQGCGRALQSYMLDCADLMDNRIHYCDEFCEASLIALTSTEEGESLMNCHCNDAFCKEKKDRIEICREKVILAKGKNSVVSCSVAHLICAADTSCATALEFYDNNCRRMFMGRSCSFRCNNSISILGRQEKAAKLQTCICDGTESFDCYGIKKNMARLCFAKKDESELREEEEKTNEIGDTSAESSGAKNSSTTSSGASSVVVVNLSRRNVNSGLLNHRILVIIVGLVSSLVVRWFRI